MNYPKVGLFIKPESQEDSEIILAAMARNGLFPSIENGGIFLGQNAQPIKQQYIKVNQLVFETGVIANVDFAQPDHEPEIQWQND